MIQYDETTQYVVEENGVLIVKELTQTESTEPQISGVYEPCVAEPTVEERVDGLEYAILMMI